MPGIKHPARHYLNFLLSRRIYGVDAAVETARELGVTVLPKEVDASLHAELAVLRRKMVFPNPFNPSAADVSADTLTFLRKWGIFEAWRSTTFLNAAIDILEHAQLRYSLEILLLGPMSPLSIADRLRHRFELSERAMNAGVVRAYSHYLWDQDALNFAEWRNFLKLYYGDATPEYLRALQAPRSPAGAAFVIAIADKDSALLGAAERYEMASAAGFRMFMGHAFGESSSANTYAAFAALNTMKSADAELDKYRGGSVELIKELQRMEPIYDRSAPLSIRDMSFLRPVLMAPQVEEEEEKP